MNNVQTKAIQENLLSIREVALALLTDDSVDLEQMASILNDRCRDIEIEMYYTEDTNRQQLINAEYEQAYLRMTSEDYEKIIEENAIEAYVASLSDLTHTKVQK